jgi:DNA polymerase (family 10)
MQLIEELGIHDLASLEYACSENRLLKLKGFGEKLQNKIVAGLAFAKASQGQLRISDAFPLAEGTLARIKEVLRDSPELRVSEAGSLRRRMEVVDGLDFLIELPARDADSLRSRLKREKGEGGLPLRLHFAPSQEFGYELARLTATESHWKALGSPARTACKTEEEFYASLDLPWIAPEMRETGEEVALARAGKLKQTLPWDGIQGVFHNHTTRSDGTATLEQMVQGARARGLKYFGISDHSQSAVYAQGLKGADLLEQEKEVRALQDKYPDIRIFWGIESDILADGSLDYDPKILKRFDFVVASVHSRFGMDRTTMTERVLEAVRNPYTTFLGHATGRLLLGRAGYDLEMERVIDTAAAHHVAIEINANPARLDIDWRWGAELRKRKTFVSVNPDAHEVEGLDDVKYGVAVARKALLPAAQVLNSLPVAEVEKWLSQK